MVLFFAGLPGVGKSTLSKGVADALDIIRLDIDEIKRASYPKLDPDYQRKLDTNIPFGEAVDMAILKETGAALEALAGKEEHVILDEMMFRRACREYLFPIADRLFGGHAIIWIRPSDEVVKKRLAENTREGHLLKDPIGTYDVLKEMFEDIENPHLVFENHADLAESLEELVPKVRELMRERTSREEQ